MNETRRNLIATGLAVPLLGGCIFGDDVFIEWDEEVLLPDKTTMMVHVKYRWEKQGKSLTPRGGVFIDRDCWLSFDSGEAAGRVTQFFKGWKPRFIGRWNGIWYLWLRGSSYGGSELEPSQGWNLSRDHTGEFAEFQNGKFIPIPRLKFPKEFVETNFFRLDRRPEHFSQLDGKVLTLEMKRDWPDKWHTYAYQIHNHP